MVSVLAKKNPDSLDAKTLQNEHTKYQVPFAHIVANGIPYEYFLNERRSAIFLYSLLLGCINATEMNKP